MMEHRARRRFGQNFLIDPNIIRRIVAVIRPLAGELIVEIGPGQAALTTPLLANGARVHAVEIDRDLAGMLRSSLPDLVLHEADALSFDFSSLGQGMRVVGNLPYNISTPLLFHLLQHRAAIRDIHVMLQKEVVDRMVAPCGSDAYGRLSVMLQTWFDLEKVLDVAPTCFRPVPKVQSAVVRLLPWPDEPGVRFEVMERVVAAAFGQRRKTLRNTLAPFFDAAELEQLGVDPSARAETIPVDAWVRLSAWVQARPATPAA